MQVKHTLALACACAVIGLITASALHADTGSEPPESVATDATLAPVLTQRERQRRIDYYRHQIWHWQRIMGAPATRKLHRAPAEFAAKLAAWRRFTVRVRLQAQNPPHKTEWLCIHRFEGAWRDPNPPYYGGLQMDVHFQRTYGAATFRRKGTADHWTPLEQMWAAERAHRSGRGFYPWPNTARYCGLI
jgi:hypothetical protein